MIDKYAFFSDKTRCVFGVMDLLFLVSSEVATTSKMKKGCCKKFDNNKSCSGHNNY